MREKKNGRRRSTLVCITAFTLLFIATWSFAQSVSMATPDGTAPPPARPNSPFSIYAVVPVEDVVNKQPTDITLAQSNSDLASAHLFAIAEILP